jgi:gluconate 5-dehydrogenase
MRKTEKIEELFSVRGKVAVVTGGSRGLGFDIVQTLAEGGCDIVITSRDADKAADAARQTGDKFGVQGIGLELDHTSYREL